MNICNHRTEAGHSACHAVWQKEDDPHSVLRVVEVLDVNTEYQEFTGWYYIHGARVKRGEYAHEMPLVQRRLVPEWRNNRTGLAEVKHLVVS